MMTIENEPVPLGAFELRHPVGRGAMGEVWAGVHLAHDTPVAIKILTGAVAERAGYALSFRQEVRACAGLDHPNIVTVYDFGHIPKETATASNGRYPAGRPYLVMELVEGGSLASRRGNLEWPELYTILLGLLDALGHAHARGLIHRDLKPHNVLLPLGPGAPAVKLTDFGLAHALDRHADDPWREHLAGTPNYMAPEQIECRWRDYGPWTDVYAFGCLAWSLVTGVPPFAARDPREVLRNQVRKAPPAMPADVLQQRGVPAGFEAWLLRMLEKEPARRYQRAADAAWALMSLVEGHAALTPDEAALTRWQLPIVTAATVDAAAPDDAVAFGAARAFTWTVEELSSLSDSDSDAGSEMPPMPALWRRPEEVRWQPLVGAGLGLFGLRAVPMVDRYTERDRLWRALRRVHRDGLPRAVVLRGAAGFGKSHLARWLCERAHEVGAATILRATHSSAGTPHDGLAAMLGRYHGCDDLPRVAVVDRMQRILESLSPGEGLRHTELAHLLAEFITGGRGESASQVPRERKISLLVEHLRLLGRRRPLVLWVEDAQWGEDAVELGRRLLEAADDVRVLLIYTVRAASAEEVPLDVEALERHPAVERVTVGPVPPTEMPALIHALLGLESDAAAQVEARCEGNPLFAVQLVGDWVQRGVLVPGALGFDLKPNVKVGLPDGVHALWRQRIEEALPEVTHQQALMLAALLGPNFDERIWQKAVRAADIDVGVEVLDRLAGRGLLAAEGSPQAPSWTFTHGMLRESLERRAEEAGHIKEAHLCCAEALFDEKTRPYPERRARHLIAGGALKPAARLLIQAGHDRLDEDDIKGAKALSLEWSRLAHELKMAPGDAQRGEARLLSCRIARAEVDSDKTALLARAALKEGEEYNWPKVVVKALIDLGWAANRAGDYDVAVARFRTATERARGRGDRFQLMSSLRNQAQILLDRGTFEEVIALLDEAIELIGDRPLHHALALCQVNRALVLRRHGRFEEASAALDAAERSFEAVSVRWGLARVLAERGTLAIAQGDAPRAVALLEEAVSRLAVIKGPTEVWARLNLARAHLAAGELDRARELFEDELLDIRKKQHEAAGLMAELGLLILAGLRRDWRAWRDWLGKVRDRLTERESTTRDAISMTEEAAHAAQQAASSARAVAALQVAEAQWRLLGITSEVERVRAEIEALRPAG